MQIISSSAQDTLKIGGAIARHLKPGDILCLYGDLGSGKTVLVKGIAQGLGIKKEKVISPTFVLIRQYQKSRIPLYHFDLYRLENEGEIINLGYEEYFYDQAVAVIEWADRLKSLKPAQSLSIRLDFKDKCRRRIKFSACGLRYKELKERISEDLKLRYQH